MRYMQHASSVSATLFLSCAGMYTSWSSPTIPKLISNDSPVGTTLTPSEASFVASSFQLGYIPGGILSGWFVARYGPKQSILVAAVPLCCAWLAVILAKSALALCVARFVAGVGSSIAATACPIYTAEVSDKDIRGRLGSIFTMLIIVGNLIVMTLGPFISYTTLAMVCCLLPLVYGIIFWITPESPYYLLKTHQLMAARRSMRTLCDQDANEEFLKLRFDEVSNTIAHDMVNKSSFWELITNPTYRKWIKIITGIKLIQQFTGVAAIDAYMQTIIKSSNSSISPEHCSIIFGVIQLLSASAAACFVDRIGRKPLLVLSAFGTALAMALEGLYFYRYGRVDYSSINADSSLLPIIGLVLFLTMHPLGLGTLFYVLLGEVFPTNIKSHAVSMYTVLYGFLGFIVVSSFEPISRLWGMHAPFFGFAAVATVGAIFILIVLPETKQKTFMEIQSDL